MILTLKLLIDNNVTNSLILCTNNINGIQLSKQSVNLQRSDIKTTTEVHNMHIHYTQNIHYIQHSFCQLIFSSFRVQGSFHCLLSLTDIKTMVLKNPQPLSDSWYLTLFVFSATSV